MEGAVCENPEKDTKSCQFPFNCPVPLLGCGVASTTAEIVVAFWAPTPEGAIKAAPVTAVEFTYT